MDGCHLRRSVIAAWTAERPERRRLSPRYIDGVQCVVCKDLLCKDSESSFYRDVCYLFLAFVVLYIVWNPFV